MKGGWGGGGGEAVPTFGQAVQLGEKVEAEKVPGWHMVQKLALASVEDQPPMQGPHCGCSAGGLGHPAPPALARQSDRHNDRRGGSPPQPSATPREQVGQWARGVHSHHRSRLRPGGSAASG